MKIQADTPEEYISKLPEDRRPAFEGLRSTILSKLPEGFEEMMGYGMLAYSVPFSIYPAGYHCDPSIPLPFVNLGNQKNFIALYHMGLYAKPELKKWFVEAYPTFARYKLDMGKSCIRFKKMEDIPYELIGALISKMGAEEWIEIYEKTIKP